MRYGRQPLTLEAMNVKGVLISIVFAGMIVPALGQVVYTAHFTKKLRQAGVEYAAPTEQWLHVVNPPQDEYMDYDLVLVNDRNDLEIRYRIGEVPEMAPPSVEVTRLVATLASNADINDIVVKIPPPGFLKEAFNAEAGVIVYFTPKAEFSQKPYGALLSLYLQDRPGMNVVLLYIDPSFDPLNSYRSLRFLDTREEE
jgi:hypothetical protein